MIEIMEKHQRQKEMIRNRVIVTNGSKITVMPKRKAYMAGKLFNNADRIQRQKEYDLLKAAHEKYNIDRDIFSPIHAPINDKSTLPSALDIFNGDEKPLLESDIMFADLTDEDVGVAMELGMVLYRDVKVYAYISDIRIETAGQYEGVNVPFGYNQFAVGGIQKYYNKVYLSFEEALKAYIKDHKR